MQYTDTVCIILELSAVIPAAILCFLPMQDHLRENGQKIVWCGLPFLLVWAVLGGVVCSFFHCNVLLWLVPSLILFGLLLCKLVDLPGWKPVSVFLAVCGVESGILNLATLFEVLVAGEQADSGLTLEGAGMLCFLTWLALGLAWYPTTHAARWLLDEIEMPGTWYVFWVLPVVFMGLNLMIHPNDYHTLYVGRMMVLYPTITIALLIILLLFYFMFYLMARKMGDNMRLLKENQLLQVQSAQYESLQRSMEETRRARHDLRQHLTVIQGCMESRDWGALSDYIKSYQESIPPEIPLSYSKNRAVDAVLRHYAEKAAQEQIDMEISVRMEAHTIIPEPEFCVLLGNLLENAVEACTTFTGGRLIQVNIRQVGAAMLSLTVDNPCPKEPVWKEERLCSGKHSGFGLGTESVRMIAERYNGDAQFWWKSGMFYASVMLNPGAVLAQ